MWHVVLKSQIVSLKPRWYLMTSLYYRGDTMKKKKRNLFTVLNVMIITLHSNKKGKERDLY